MDTTSAREDRILAALARLDGRLAQTADVGPRVSRLEGETARLRESMVLRSDVMALGARIEGLTKRIDALTEQVAATAPRLRMAEAGVAELRLTTARQSHLERVEQAVAGLSDRIAAETETQTARSAKLSSQVIAWLVSLILLVVGAMVSYALLAGSR